MDEPVGGGATRVGWPSGFIVPSGSKTLVADPLTGASGPTVPEPTGDKAVLLVVWRQPELLVSKIVQPIRRSQLRRMSIDRNGVRCLL